MLARATVVTMGRSQVAGFPIDACIGLAVRGPAVHLRAQLALQLRQAPDPGAVGAEVGLDLGGQFVDGGEVNAEQLRACSSGAAIGRPTSTSFQVPTEPAYRTQVRDRIASAA